MKFKINCKMDMTIVDENLPQRKRTRLPIKEPMGELFEIEGDIDSIKDEICSKLDELTKVLKDWFDNC
jgi:hypothetical protein